MFSARIILLAVLVFATAFSATAQKSDANEWTMEDYVNNLPEKYITTHGVNFATPTAKTMFVDVGNDYASHIICPPTENWDYEPYAVFQMGLFKSQAKPPLLVVSNYLSGDCDTYETFFLRRVGGNWKEVKRGILPPLNFKMFWDAPQSAGRLLKIIKERSISYHFEPTRRGMQLKVSLEICDNPERNETKSDYDELRKLIKSAKSFFLDWDSKNGKFIFAK